MMNSLASVYVAAGGNTIALKSGWTSLWGKIAGQFGTLFTALTMIGAALVAGAVFKYFWDRRRGQAQMSHLVWTCLAGAILAGPNLVIPIALGIIDVVVNAVFNMFSGIGS